MSERTYLLCNVLTMNEINWLHRKKDESTTFRRKIVVNLLARSSNLFIGFVKKAKELLKKKVNILLQSMKSSK